MKQRLRITQGLIIAAFCLTASTAPAWFSSDKNTASAQKNDLPPEYRAITNQIAETQTRYDALIRNVEQTLSTARDRLSALQTQEASLTNEISTSESHIAQLKQTNEQRYQELEAQQQKLKQAETILGEKNARILQLTDAVQAEKILKEKEEASALLKQQLDDQKKQAAAQNDRATAETGNLKNEVDAQAKLLEEQKKTIEELQNTLAKTRSEKAEADGKNQTLQALVAQLQEQNKTLQATQQNAITGVSATLREFNDFLNTQTNTTVQP